MLKVLAPVNSVKKKRDLFEDKFVLTKLLNANGIIVTDYVSIYTQYLHIKVSPQKNKVSSLF